MKTTYSNSPEQVLTGKDNVIIQKYISGIKGGRTLDVTGFKDKTISAGHVVVKSEAGVYKPMPVVGEAYGTLPVGHSYVGVVVSSVLTSKPAVSIMTNGEINDLACVYPLGSIKEAFLEACPQIVIVKGEEA